MFGSFLTVLGDFVLFRVYSRIRTMQNNHFEEYIEKYQEAQLKIDSYLIRRMNLIASQTVVRLGDFNLIGALAMISFKESQLVAVLSPNEISHFNRFVGKASTLLLAFDKPGVKEPVRFHLRVSLVSITPLPNRANICIVRLVFKMIPPEFMTMLCDLFDDLESRKNAYQTHCEEMMEIDPKDFHVAAIKPKAELSLDGKKTMVGINSISSCRANVTIVEWPYGSVDENRFTLKLLGIAGSFPVGCAFEEKAPEAPGNYAVTLDFSNELIYNIEEWKTRISIRARSAKQASS